MNMMYELIVAQKKAKEAATMGTIQGAQGLQVKPKYEYDSDEDVTDGTWEHKQRRQEMMATADYAEKLTEGGRGKHFIGDFLPPEELEKFMETFKVRFSFTPQLVTLYEIGTTWWVRFFFIGLREV